MSRAVGIDLGTTNSVVAVFEGGEPTVVANAEGHRTTPSVVAFSKSGEVLVGEVAKRQAITNPDRTIRSAKRHMGTDWSVDIDGKDYSSQEISARILMKLKRDAEAYLGDRSPRQSSPSPPTSTTPSVRPPRKPASIAGLEVLRIINEPTAAALAYGLDKDGGPDGPRLRPRWRHLRCLGARDRRRRLRGPFDRGDTNLGGDDWDEAVIDWLATSFKNDHGVDLRQGQHGPAATQGSRGEGQDRTVAAQKPQINLPFITATDVAPTPGLHAQPTKFQEMTATSSTAATSPFERAIKDAGLTQGRN